MEKVDKIKEIVSAFLKVSPSEINNDTPVNRRAVGSSVMLHRMYAALKSEGFDIKDRRSVKSFSDLIGKAGEQVPAEERKADASKKPHAAPEPSSTSPGPDLLGIDIEECANMPDTKDYREDEFYKENFSGREITYCMEQPNPCLSFAGHFAAKEAVVKADNRLRDIPFKDIEITNDSNGKPSFRDFSLSISHTESYAAAIAFKRGR